MKQLICEMCGSNDLIKDGVVFVCQSCGCKYSVEEAKKMMVEGVVEVQGTVAIDYSGKIDNYIELSMKSSDASSMEFANKALEIDSKNPKAWIAKLKAYDSVSTVGNPNFEYRIEAIKNVLEYAGDNKNEFMLDINDIILPTINNILTLANSKIILSDYDEFGNNDIYYNHAYGALGLLPFVSTDIEDEAGLKYAEIANGIDKAVDTYELICKKFYLMKHKHK